MDFSQRFDALMVMSMTSNYALSKAIGVSDSLIGTWRTGKKKPTLDNIRKISEHFQVSSDYLLCISNDPKAENVRYAPLELADPRETLRLKLIRDGVIPADRQLSSDEWKAILTYAETLVKRVDD